MRAEYKQWLAGQGYQENTQNAQIYRVKKVEDAYDSLDAHFINGTYQEVVETLKYSTKDKRENKPNPSKIKFDGDIKNNLQSYRDAVLWYQKFLKETEAINLPLQVKNSIENTNIYSSAEDKQQKLSLERDMQIALRRNISSLESSLRIIDDGAERAVDSGLIDITCEDNNSIIVVELKAGKADSRAIAQILGYMGDLQEENDEKPVRGILVAHDFDKRTKSAARVVPTLKLVKYAIEFKFTAED